MHRLRERDKDRGDTELAMNKILDNVSVESKNTKFVRAHYARKELHHEDLMIKGKPFFITIEDVVYFLRECLRIVEKLECRKVGGRVGFIEVFLMKHETKR